MELDFTLDKYKKLCNAMVESQYLPVCVATYLTEGAENYTHTLILRHDVDRKPEQALKMAEIEASVGIVSTYYFRTTKNVFLPSIIRKISDLGHEIGYHYEVLDKTKGDFEKAIKLFEDELQGFRELYDVKTICMHGNPLSKWDNRNLWVKYNFEDFDVIGEPYFSIDYKEVYYLTDTGRSWNSKYNIKDLVGTDSNQTISHPQNTNDVINLINQCQLKQICILMHPNRWTGNIGSWLKEYTWQNSKNIGKSIIKRLIAKRSL